MSPLLRKDLHCSLTGCVWACFRQQANCWLLICLLLAIDSILKNRMVNRSIARVTMREGRGNAQGEGMWEGGHGKSDQLKWVKKGWADGSLPPEVKFSETGKLKDCAHSPIHLPGQMFTQATCAHCSFVLQGCVCVCYPLGNTSFSDIRFCPTL